MSALAVGERLGVTIRGLLLVAGGLLLGVASAWLAQLTHPVVLVLLPAGLGVLAATLARPAVGLLLTVGALPAGMTNLEVPGVPLQVVEVGVAASAGAIVLACLLARRPALGWSEPMWPLLLLLGMVVVSAADSAAPESALTQCVLLAGGVVLVSVSQAACTRAHEVRWIAGALMVSGALVAAVAARGLGSMRVYHGGAVVEGRATGVFVQPNELGAFTAMIVVLSVALVLGARGGWWRIAALASLAVSGVALALSLSRGGWVGVLFGLAAYVVLLPRPGKLVLRAGVASLLFAAVVAVPVLRSPPETVEVVATRATSVFEGSANPHDARPAMWSEAVRLAFERPLVGHGPASFPIASTSTPDAGLVVQWAHAHNTLLTVGAELGLIAVAALVGFSVAVAVVARRAARRLRTRADQHLAAGLAAAAATQMGHGVVDFHLRNSMVLMTALLLTGLVLALARTPEASP